MLIGSKLTRGLNIVAALGLLVGGAVAHADASQPQKIKFSPDKMFAPTGFDDNDNAQIVLSGSYPNTCYKAGQVSAQVDESAHKITVRNEAYLHESDFCLMVMVPWSQTVNLGTVPSGEYEVDFEQDNGVAKADGTLAVSHSTHTGADDYMYAMVDEVTLEDAPQGIQTLADLPAPGPTTHKLKIKGSLPSSCAKLKEVKVFHNNKDVYEVLPVVEVPMNRICSPILRPFSTTVELGGDSKGEKLVHVRSLNGQAVNRVLKF